MTEQTIDLSGASRPESYSAHTLGLAQYALRAGKLKRVEGSLTAAAQSLSGPEVWHPSASLDARGFIVGMTCTCPNGKRGGVRARCWHAAALEHEISGDWPE